ncbi:alpha-glucosidase [Pseudoalteromonas luteoviolacea]|uniref:Alpha-glucosidase n=1 Tax=Pseudoalteromonas luteoviolacea S4054 TaxID=1129367 RepID=A0A0F6A5I2_9GAMM|nr:alpha-glucosidase [Pseudoalteromonas luteoviolacea]AOT07613.1 alpha-glucosidase [Pseudoalteromonas luteoviolacea]AOT12529.1 alpha-glucosidase [Pseudoalteromonas luteoviolacea]AOT17443.1 alpha-glucosidase [Pseudoalteromonas luteoviolacea]KKE81353.1 alpha-glucosidase [Pseudoalteromonas luteoviolacea S4054]KZN70638.1 alpha-glucosidase [Pseudoalteromonas luteoviolacea S4047-1]
MAQNEWWKGAVIYQVYPRSFKDTKGDGIGDLNGIIERLDYIKSLGVDAIWISPFFKSPMKDFGYDISDYRDIDPMFGNIEDFDNLIAQAHQRDIKIIIDQVLSHTSNEHPWFVESRQDKNNEKSDWYVWADAKPDGSPPNNWLSIFGGVAWQWEPRRCQYYLHNFLTEQPDLNFHNPQVRQAVLDNVKFWLDKGVNGFRLDAINFCFHDSELKDNPAKPKELRQGRGFSEDNPYAFQYHYYNNTQPENLDFMAEIRALLNEYPGTVSLGEISSEDSLKTMAEYTSGGDKLHMGYSFELLTNDYSAEYIRETVSRLEAVMTEGWPCWAFSNHDVERVASRWSKDGQTVNPQQVKMLTALLGSLRGSVCMYQGEELGLGEAQVAFEDLQDPYGITFWPNFKGRDGCRTPMPWSTEQAHAGFTDGKPWLPVAEAHSQTAVNLQEKDDDSILAQYRAFLAWRKTRPELISGDIEFIATDEPILAFYRTQEDKKLLCLFNLTEQTSEFVVEQSIKDSMDELAHHTGTLQANKVTLPGYGCYFASI